jgi:hypothetical protein
MVGRSFSIKGLVPEKYRGHDIYVHKQARASGRRYYDLYYVKITPANSSTVIHSFVHYGNASGWGGYTPATKETAVDQAKKYLDQKGESLALQAVQVGDLFYTSWGYDQTNYDFIVVTAVSPTGKTVKARRAMHRTVGHGEQTDIQVPLNEPFGDEFQLKVEYEGGVPKLRGSYPYLGDGKGDTRFGYFKKHEEGETYSETDAYSGH